MIEDLLSEQSWEEEDARWESTLERRADKFAAPALTRRSSKVVDKKWVLNRAFTGA